MSGMSDARKARLIGACALVFVGFVLLSWLLGGGDHRHQATAATSDEPVIVLPARPVRTAQVGGDDAPADAPKTSEPVAAAPPPAVAEPEPEPAPRPAARGRTTPTASEPAPAKPEQGWYVQLGVFGSQNNANALAKKAREGDYRTEVRSLQQSGNTLHRVLVGPYPSEAAAELRVPKLQRWLGEQGRVVALER